MRRPNTVPSPSSLVGSTPARSVAAVGSGARHHHNETVVWIALAGIVLQVFGLAVAVRGLASTYRTVFHSSLGRDLASDVVRAVRRRKPPTVVGAIDTVIEPVAGSVFTVSRPPEPAAGASEVEQLAYLRSYVAQLSNELEASRSLAQDQLDRTERRLSERLTRLETTISAAQGELRTIGEGAFGNEGKGVRQAAVGLGVTLVGVALTAFGLPW